MMTSVGNPVDVQRNNYMSISFLTAPTSTYEDIPRSTIKCQWAACNAQLAVDELLPHLSKQHLVARSKDSNIVCRWDHCEMPHDGSVQLTEHLRHQHLDRPLLGCQWQDCMEKFSDFAALTEHLSEFHIGHGKAEYICLWRECQRRNRPFSQRQKLMRHIQTHTGDKPYECSTCHMRFSESSIMAQHRRTHTGEKPFHCDYDGCNRSFSLASSLKTHLRTHTDEKPYQCNECDKKFRERSNLSKHQRTHSGIRPFVCELDGCGKRFARSDQVKRHKKVHMDSDDYQEQ